MEPRRLTGSLDPGPGSNWIHVKFQVQSTKLKTILIPPPIGSDAGDCAPASSHTTGHAVCSHPAVERSFHLHGEARSDGIQNPWRRKTALLSAVCKLGLAAIRHAPLELCATFSRRPLRPKLRSWRSRP